MGTPEKSNEAVECLRSIGARLLLARKAKGLSQTEAARRTEGGPWGTLDQDGWSRLENAKGVATVLQIRAAADAVGLDPSDLAFGAVAAGVSDVALLIDRRLARGDLRGALDILATQLPESAPKQP